MADLQSTRAAIENAIDAHAPNYPDLHSQTYRRLEQVTHRFLQQLTDSVRVDPPLPDLEVMARVKELVWHPVFIFGHYRSGTSLFRHMLDGHPALAVFPAEGRLLGTLRRHSQKTYYERCLLMLKANFEQLVFSDQGNGPIWLLDNAGQTEPYRQFVGIYWQMIENLPEREDSPIRAAITAYLVASGDHAAERRHWVHKAPKDEKYTEDLLEFFPDARFIFVVRDPRAIIASAKQRHLKKYGNFKLQATTQSIRESWCTIRQTQARLGEDLCHLVSYEGVITRTEEVMQGVTNFLNIPFDPIVLTPTLGDGRPAYQNTGYNGKQTRGVLNTSSLERWQNSLSSAEIDFVSAFVHPYEEVFGYPVGRTSFVAYASAIARLMVQYARADLTFRPRSALKAWRSRR